MWQFYIIAIVSEQCERKCGRLSNSKSNKTKTDLPICGIYDRRPPQREQAENLGTVMVSCTMHSCTSQLARIVVRLSPGWNRTPWFTVKLPCPVTSLLTRRETRSRQRRSDILNPPFVGPLLRGTTVIKTSHWWPFLWPRCPCPPRLRVCCSFSDANWNSCRAPKGYFVVLHLHSLYAVQCTWNQLYCTNNWIKDVIWTTWYATYGQCHIICKHCVFQRQRTLV